MRTTLFVAALAIPLLAACGGGAESAESADTAPAVAAPAAAPAAQGDATVPGTQYQATASVPCAFDGAAVEGGCQAGVKRGWAEDGGAMVEVTKPDGRTRAIFYTPAGAPFSADSAEADGSAGWEFRVTRQGDTNVIDYGPEHYEIPDAFVTGG
jgi:hypothetical protein